MIIPRRFLVHPIHAPDSFNGFIRRHPLHEEEGVCRGCLVQVQNRVGTDD
jgi:hypothetical protein